MVICLDIGGTSIKSCLFDETKNDLSAKIGETFKVPTNAKEGLEGIKNAIKESINHYLPNDIKYIAISSAGTIDEKTSTITYATDNLPGVIGFNFDRFTMKTFNLHSYALNDAKAALYGEMAFGNGKGFETSRVLMITIGTGIGSAVYQNGNVESTTYGHITLKENGRYCTCGKYGCIEAYISATGIFSRLKEMNLEGINPFTNNEFINEYEFNFYKSISLIHYHDRFDVLLLGGGVIDMMGEYSSTLIQNIPYTTKKASLGNDAGLFGALYFSKKI